MAAGIRLGYIVMTRGTGRHSETGVPQIDSVLPLYRIMAPAGFILAFNLTMRGPEYFHSEYPKDWQREYERKNYAWGDPILLWAAVNTGDKRWSDVRLPDLVGVFKAAERFNIRYGATFSRKHSGKKSVLTVAHDTREFTDEEMTILARSFDMLVVEAKIDGTLTEVELDTLRCVQQGMEYPEIAALLGISVPTVKVRVEKARTKLGARNTAQAVAIAVRRNYI